MKRVKIKTWKQAEHETFKASKPFIKIDESRIENYSEDLLSALEQFADEIGYTILAYNGKSTNETMMISGLRKSSQETTNRKTHMENLEGIAVEVAKKIGLNVGVTRIIARNHDIGHTFLGHNGEYWLSNIKDSYGMGYYTHNALGVQQLIYHYNIYDRIIEKIKAFNPDISDKLINRIRSSLWLIFDGINSHNGERTETEFVPDKEKDEKRFKNELMECFTTKGFDKTILPATIEGCLIRLCDKISYIPYDMVDGIREGMIEGIDSEYTSVLNAIGVTEDEIERANTTKNYEAIARKLQIIFTKDVIQNSDKTAIRMSKRMAMYMHRLRDMNNDRIVKYVLMKEDNEIYPKAINALMNRFQDIMRDNGVVEMLQNEGITPEAEETIMKKYVGTPYEDFVKYIVKLTPEDCDFTADMLYLATERNIENEQKIARDIVFEREDFLPRKGYEDKSARIKLYAEEYRKRGIKPDYSKEEIERDVQEEISRQLIDGDPKGPKMKEKIELEFGIRFISTLNDIEFFDLLKKFNMLTPEQEKSLRRAYREIGIEGLHIEADPPINFEKMVKEQQEELARQQQALKAAGEFLRG